MSTHPGETRLNEWLDGELDERAAADVANHVAGCVACRTEADRLRELLAAAAALAPSVEPDRDLWQGIESRIDAAGVADLDAWRARRAGGLWAHRYQLAAAATLLVLMASTGTFLLMREQAPAAPVASTPAPASAPPPGTVRLVSEDVPGHAAYVDAIRELDALLRARSDRLDPQTIDVVERNMAIIDQAIREARAALAADPANGELNRAVSAAYKTKINLLQRAVQLPART